MLIEMIMIVVSILLMACVCFADRGRVVYRRDYRQKACISHI